MFEGNARSLPPSSSIGVLGRLWPYSKILQNAEGLQCLYVVRLVSHIVVDHARILPLKCQAGTYLTQKY
jgi:hypothetical protein